MGMVPELPIAMLACARIGAPHVVVFGGFSAESLGERMDSTGATLLITQDEARRKGGLIPLKQIADQALAHHAPSIKNMVVLQRTGAGVPMTEGRDTCWHDLVGSSPAIASRPAATPRTSYTSCTPPAPRQSRRQRSTPPVAT